MKVKITVVLVLIAILTLTPILSSKAFALNGVEKVDWCHCEPNGNCQTLKLPLAALINAGHVSAGGNPLHAGDHPGVCEEPPPEVCPWDDQLTVDDPNCEEPPEVCPWNDQLTADDPNCEEPPEVCPWNDQLTVDDPNCEKPPEVCPWDNQLTVDDPNCEKPPEVCPWNDKLSVDDPTCEEPKEERKEIPCQERCGPAQQELYAKKHVTSYIYNAVGCHEDCGFLVSIAGFDVDLIVTVGGIPIEELGDDKVKFERITNSFGTHSIYEFPQSYWSSAKLMTHNEAGELVPLREVYGWYDENHISTVLKYIVCSMWPSAWNIKDGILHVHDAMNSSDVAYYLMLEGYFESFADAHDYTLQYWLDPVSGLPYEPLSLIEIPLP